MRFLIILLIISCCEPSQANIFDPRLWSADHSLQKEKYSQARESYIKIQPSDPHNPRLNYNLGIAQYREGDFDKALSSYQRAIEEAKSPLVKEAAFYNAGNALFMQENYQGAIEKYENALKINPKDEDAEYNLALAKKMLDQQKKDKDKDKKNNQDKNKDKDKQNQGKNKNKEDQKKKQEKQQQSQQKQQDINNLLNQLQEADPRKVNQEKKPRPVKTLKPW